MNTKDANPAAEAQAILSRMSRFTVLRGILNEEPLSALKNLLNALSAGDAFNASEQYHIMSHSLLTGGFRRISGDIFHDFLLYCLLERENAFSVLAAKSTWDEPLALAMRADLTLFNSLFSLNSATLKKMIGECSRAPNPQKRPKVDNIAVMSSAVWSGGSLRPLPSVAEPDPGADVKPANMEEADFISWRYQPEEGGGSYVSDSALTELYRRILNTEDRGLLLDDIWNFHAAYGTGIFIRERLFMLKETGELSPIRLSGEIDAYGLYQEQRELEMKNTVRFMQGEHADNMLITGAPGTGKTLQVFALARELPELRLIVCPPNRLKALIGILHVMLNQPYRFMLMLDDFDSGDSYWPQLRAEIAPGGTQPDNLIVAACARLSDDAFFPLRIHLAAPQFKEFIELVQLILLQEGKDIDYERIQNACIDYAASANGVSFRSAGLIAQSLSAE